MLKKKADLNTKILSTKIKKTLAQKGQHKRSTRTCNRYKWPASSKFEILVQLKVLSLSTKILNTKIKKNIKSLRKKGEHLLTTNAKVVRKKAKNRLYLQSCTLERKNYYCYKCNKLTNSEILTFSSRTKASNYGNHKSEDLCTKVMSRRNITHIAWIHVEGSVFREESKNPSLLKRR